MTATHRIVVLDSVTFTKTQLENLHKLGEVVQYEGTPSSDDQIIERLRGADVCILGWTQISASLLEGLRHLKMIAVWATGVNYVDLVAAARLGIKVTNVPAYAANAVAELTLGFMIALSRRLLIADQHVRAGKYRWQEFCGTELSGKTLGIIGLGSIGKRVAHLAQALGMTVVGYTAHPSPERSIELRLEFKQLPELAEMSDFVSLNCPLVDGTRHLIDANLIARFRPTACLINTARYHVVDPDALVAALQTGKIAGAALDDLDLDAPSVTVLKKLPNVILSPHAGFNTREAIWTKTNICIDNVERYLNGRPRNLVAPG